MDSGTRKAVANKQQWLKEHRRMMLSYARRYAGTVSRAEDIVQEALTIAWSRRDKAATVDSLERWLLGITKNVGLRTVTKRKRRAGHNNTLRADPPYWLRDDVLEEWLSGNGGQDSWDRVLEALDQLPPAQRRVLLDMLDGTEDSEIAENEAIAVATVRVRRYRAISSLRQALFSGAPQDGPATDQAGSMAAAQDHSQPPRGE